MGNVNALMKDVETHIMRFKSTTEVRHFFGKCWEEKDIEMKLDREDEKSVMDFLDVTDGIANMKKEKPGFSKCQLLGTTIIKLKKDGKYDIDERVLQLLHDITPCVCMNEQKK